MSDWLLTYKQEILWVSVMAIMIIAEVATVQVVSFWFAVGAGLALLLAFLDFSMGVQVIVFLVVSLALLFVFKKFMDKTKSERKEMRGDVYEIVGKEALVIGELKPGHSGRIKVLGDDWSAKLKDGEHSVIRPGMTVTVVEMIGVTCYVVPTYETMMALEENSEDV